VSPDLASIRPSFTTNTNWQSYGGESTLSCFSQMVALVIHNFGSAATGSPSRRRWCGASPGARPRLLALLGPIWCGRQLSAAANLPRVRASGIARHHPDFKPYTKAQAVEPMKITVEKKNEKANPSKGLTANR